MKRFGLTSLTSAALLAAASSPNDQQRPILAMPNDQHTLPVQPPGEDFLYSDERPAPPPIKIAYASDDKTPKPNDKQPPPPPSSSPFTPQTQPSISLSDAIGPNKAITSFSSLTRMQSSTDSLLSDLSTNTTVLAPLNSVIENLPRKPWEDPRDYQAFGASAYEASGGGGQDLANKNLLRFVEAHLVTKSPWREGEKATTLGGREVWWEQRNGKRVVMPDKVEVEKVANSVANGELWLINGVINYEKAAKET